MLNLFGIYKGKLKIWCRKTICLNLLHLYIWLLLFQTQTNVHYCFILVLTAVRVSILMVLTLATVLVQDMKGQIAQQVIFLLSSIILHILYQSFCLRLIHTKMFMFSLVYSYMNKYTQNTTQAIPFHQINAFTSFISSSIYPWTLTINYFSFITTSYLFIIEAEWFSLLLIKWVLLCSSPFVYLSNSLYKYFFNAYMYRLSKHTE